MMTSDEDSYEDRYRQYLQDVSTDNNFDLTTVENWEEWMESEKEREDYERFMLEDMKPESAPHE